MAKNGILNLLKAESEDDEYLVLAQMSEGCWGTLV